MTISVEITLYNLEIGDMHRLGKLVRFLNAHRIQDITIQDQAVDDEGTPIRKPRGVEDDDDGPPRKRKARAVD